MVSDLVLFICRILTDPEIDNEEPYADLENNWTLVFFCLSSSTIYLEYFLICTLGIVDFAKKD